MYPRVKCDTTKLGKNVNTKIIGWDHTNNYMKAEIIKWHAL
jgi:hypothetical protein